MYPALTEIKSGSPQGPGAGLRRFFREIIFTKNMRENDFTGFFFHKLENITHHYRDFSSPANSSGFIWNQNIKQIKNCFFKKSKILYKINYSSVNYILKTCIISLGVLSEIIIFVLYITAVKILNCSRCYNSISNYKFQLPSIRSFWAWKNF